MPKILTMIDIESLDVGPRSVVTQMAFYAVDMQDPETLIRQDDVYLPIQPQLALNRTISASTLIWWMRQDEKAREKFQYNEGVDMDELLAIVGSFASKLSQVLIDASEGEYEIWARGPQFDIVNIESLLNDCGQDIPWKYDRIRDLRTMLSLAGVGRDDVQWPAGLVKHHALSDCRFQVDCYVEGLRRLRANS